MWPAIASLAGGLGQDITNWFSQTSTNQQNLQIQQEDWAREDTAVQRRVADLKAAGLSPVLAAGSAASTMAPIQVKAPQVSQMGDLANNAMAMMTQKKQMEQADASIAKTKADSTQQERINTINSLMDQMQSDNGPSGMVGIAQNLYATQSANRAAAESVADKAAYDAQRSATALSEDNYNLGIARSRGLPTTATGQATDLANLSDWWKNSGEGNTARGVGLSVLLKLLEGGAKIPGAAIGAAIK